MSSTAHRPQVASHTGHENRPLLGIGLKLGSVCVFLSMATLIKASEGIPPGELGFFRSLFAIPPVVIFLLYQGQLLDGLKTDRPLGHLWRGFVGTCGMGLGFFALTKLPLAEATAIGYATPLLIVVFSALLLHETVRLYRWSAVVIGMIGVAIIMWPRLTAFTSGTGMSDELAIGAIAAFTGCFFSTAAMIQVRRLLLTERSATIVIYFFVVSTLICLLTLPFGWVWPTPEQTAMLIGAGIAGGIGQILLTECYRYADMSVIAPFEYSSLLLSIGVGFIVFGDVISVQMIIGSLLVVAAGIFIVFREHRLGLERKRARQVTTPQG